MTVFGDVKVGGLSETDTLVKMSSISFVTLELLTGVAFVDVV